MEGLERRVSPTAHEEAERLERLSIEKENLRKYMEWLQQNLQNIQGNLSAMRDAYNSSIQQVKDFGPDSEAGKRLFGSLTPINEEMKKCEAICVSMATEIESYQEMQVELRDSIKPRLN